jgi:adenosine kinase
MPGILLSYLFHIIPTIVNVRICFHIATSHLESPEAKDIISKAELFYVTGFFLTVSLDAILHLGKYAVQNSKIFSMNLSAPFLIQFFGEQMAAAMPYTDIVFGNESEAEAYGKAKG